MSFSQKPKSLKSYMSGQIRDNTFIYFHLEVWLWVLKKTKTYIWPEKYLRYPMENSVKAILLKLMQDRSIRRSKKN